MSLSNIANDSTAMRQTSSSTTRSCLTCAKAKAKCIWSQDGTEQNCQRCKRLGKECVRKEIVARRKKPGTSTRAAQLQKLESKLDSLVNALSSSTTPQIPAASSLSSQAPTMPTASPSTYQMITPARSDDFSQPSPAYHRPPNQEGSNASRHEEVLNTMCGGHDQLFEEASKNTQHVEHVAISPLEAEVLLERYTRLMASYMPFVVLPADATPQSLYESNPLLLRAIVTVALFHDLPRQRSCVKDLIREIGERIMVKGERSVDLLQCVMVVIAWYHPHSFWFNQMTMLLHLAIALTVDTCIDRPGPKADTSRKSSDRAQDLANHRILLGVFYYTSTMGTNFGNKMSALTFTPYMEQCLSTIETTREYDSDMHLVQTVRTQQLIGTLVSTNKTHMPSKVYTAAVRADLDRIRQNSWNPQLQARLEDDVPLRLHRLTAELHAWEVSLADLFETHTDILTKHLEDIYACINTIQSIFDLVLAIPTSEYFFATFSIFDHFVYALLTFTKLALIGSEPWIRSALNEKIRFGETFELFSTRFESAAKTAPDGIAIDNTSFGAWGKKLRWAKQVWEAKMSHQTKAAAHEGGNDGHGDRLARTFHDMELPTPAESLDNSEFFNYLDVSFWDNFGDFDLGFAGPDTFG